MGRRAAVPIMRRLYPEFFGLVTRDSSPVSRVLNLISRVWNLISSVQSSFPEFPNGFETHIMVSSAAVPPPRLCPIMRKLYPGFFATASRSRPEVWPMIQRAAASIPKWEYPKTTPLPSTRWCGLLAPVKLVNMSCMGRFFVRKMARGYPSLSICTEKVFGPIYSTRLEIIRLGVRGLDHSAS